VLEELFNDFFKDSIDPVLSSRDSSQLHPSKSSKTFNISKNTPALFLILSNIGCSKSKAAESLFSGSLSRHLPINSINNPVHWPSERVGDGAIGITQSARTGSKIAKGGSH